MVSCMSLKERPGLHLLMAPLLWGHIELRARVSIPESGLGSSGHFPLLPVLAEANPDSSFAVMSGLPRGKLVL